MGFVRIVAVVALSLLLACAGEAPPMYTASQLDEAQQAGTLSEVFESVSAKLATLDPSDKQRPKLEALLAEIGPTVAQERVAEIRQLAQASALPSGMIPLTVIDEQKEHIPSVSRYDAATAREFEDELETERGRTQAAIDESLKSADALPDDDIAGRLELMGRVAELAGPGSDAESVYRLERDRTLDELTRSAAEAMETEQYDEAQKALRQLTEVDPDNQELSEQLAQADSKVFEQQFWQALEDGKPDAAYQQFAALSESENFDEVRPRLEGSADTMAQFFVTLAAAATREGKLPDAYRWFRQARDIRELLDQNPKAEVPEEQMFVDSIHARFEKAKAEELYGLAWGYLSIIRELRPNYPTLRRETRETGDQVLQRAIKRLSAGAFEDSKTGTESGATVGSKVVQYLFEKIPNDVRIIERAKLEDVESEDADYLLQGSILEARVDASEEKGQQTLRVVTETERVTNPRYVQWLALTAKEREKRPAPEETVLVDKKEDITVNTTHHRKVGLFSTSFRLIDAESGKVLFADSVRRQSEHVDTSSEGIQIGSFKKEFEIADLPSDLEILAELADEISNEIGSQLAEILVNPEASYEKSARRYLDEGSYLDAAQDLGYALALRIRKDEDIVELRDELMRTSVLVKLP